MIKPDEKLPLVLILGNGFDLSHGARTSFTDFSESILDLLSNEIIKVNDNKKHSPFFKRHLNDFLITWRDPSLLRYDDKDLEPLYKLVINRNLEGISKVVDNAWFIQRYLQDELLKVFLRNKNNEWFSIESAYFETLIQKTGKNDIQNLNDSLNSLTKLLHEYLSNIRVEFKDSILSFFEKKIFKYENILVVNFNYTESIDQYIQKYKHGGSVRVINIHGTLRENNIIFGYGNDKHKRYKELLETGEDEFMTHMKTYEYVMRNDYQKLISELKGMNYYNVFILGHSLGITDKTMLQEILMTEKCVYVEFFKRSFDTQNEIKRDMKNKYISLGRIIENDSEVRSKAVTFENSIFFP